MNILSRPPHNSPLFVAPHQQPRPFSAEKPLTFSQAQDDNSLSPIIVSAKAGADPKLAKRVAEFMQDRYPKHLRLKLRQAGYQQIMIAPTLEEAVTLAGGKANIIHKDAAGVCYRNLRTGHRFIAIEANVRAIEMVANHELGHAVAHAYQLEYDYSGKNNSPQAKEGYQQFLEDIRFIETSPLSSAQQRTWKNVQARVINNAIYKDNPYNELLGDLIADLTVPFYSAYRVTGSGRLSDIFPNLSAHLRQVLSLPS